MHQVLTFESLGLYDVLSDLDVSLQGTAAGTAVEDNAGTDTVSPVQFTSSTSVSSL
jgi:hypothetical protein